MDIEIFTFPHFEGLALPEYATEGSAGMDLRSAEPGDILLEPMARKAVRTGIAIRLPSGFEGQVRPRSGLSLKQGIGIVNSPGTIDSDYRGEILVPLINYSASEVRIARGTRIAQLVVAPVTRVSWRRVEHLSQTERGGGGFGHTGER